MTSEAASVSQRYNYVLYTYFRSSCSARVRIAAHLKGINMEYKYIHLLKHEQHGGDYTALNPSESVPTLIVIDKESGQTVAKICQSVAILEFLEEVETETTKLLADDPTTRAKVRELVNVISNDVQPVTNMRVMEFIKPQGIDAAAWQKHFMGLGFKAYEELAKLHAGRYSVGDQVTLADCVLAPAVDNCLRFGVNVEQDFPRTWKIWTELKEHEAFQKGRWNRQGDTPEDLKS